MMRAKIMVGLAVLAGLLSGCGDSGNPGGRSWVHWQGQPPGVPEVRCTGGSATFERQSKGVMTAEEIALCREAIRTPVRAEPGAFVPMSDGSWRRMPEAPGRQTDRPTEIR